MKNGVRVLTWNLWWRWGPWEQRQAAIRSTLRNSEADIITLQEVWGEPDGTNQAQGLAEELGFHHVFAPASAIDSISLGNAILSRWPIAASETIPLDVSTDAASSDDHRVGLFATIEAPWGPTPVMTTHLVWQRLRSQSRQEQVRRLVGFLEDTALAEVPPILAGDFNADPDADEIRMITGRSASAAPKMVFQDAWEQAGDGSRGDTWTPESKHFPATRKQNIVAMPWLRRRLDYIFVGLPEGRPNPTTPIFVERAWLEGKGDTEAEEGSDHYAVVADLAPHLIPD